MLCVVSNVCVCVYCCVSMCMICLMLCVFSVLCVVCCRTGGGWGRHGGDEKLCRGQNQAQDWGHQLRGVGSHRTQATPATSTTASMYSSLLCRWRVDIEYLTCVLRVLAVHFEQGFDYAEYDWCYKSIEKVARRGCAVPGAGPTARRHSFLFRQKTNNLKYIQTWIFSLTTALAYSPIPSQIIGFSPSIKTYPCTW